MTLVRRSRVLSAPAPKMCRVDVNVDALDKNQSTEIPIPVRVPRPLPFFRTCFFTRKNLIRAAPMLITMAFNTKHGGAVDAYAEYDFTPLSFSSTARGMDGVSSWKQYGRQYYIQRCIRQCKSEI